MTILPMQFIKTILVGMLVVGICSTFYTENVIACDLSDKEAVSLAIEFTKKMGIVCSQEPLVIRTEHEFLVHDYKFKSVVFGARGSYTCTMHASCDTREINLYRNSEQEQQVRNRYRIPNDTQKKHNWPAFLSERDARNKILAIFDKINLSKDYEFQDLWLEKENGTWSGIWTRKLKEYPYEYDRVKIEIMAVDGEFIFYGKRSIGKPCPTNVKITREDAIEEGWRQIVRLFKQVNWSKQKPDFEIKSAELKIVQPNVLAGRIVQHWSTESRLAWVLVYGLRTHPDSNKLKEIDYHQQITIKIDAATNKFLGGDFSQ